MVARKKASGGSSQTARVMSGIPGLDPLIQGGLPKGSTTLVTGAAGTGKTILGLQYLVAGAIKGEKGVYINFDEEPAQLHAQAKQFGWDLEKLEKDGKLKILNFDMTKTHVVTVIVEMENFVKKMKPARLVLDSISILGIYSQVSAGAELSQVLGVRGENSNIPMDEIIGRGSIMGIVKRVRSLGATSLIISELPEETKWLSRDTVSEFVCDGIIVLTKSSTLNKRNLRIEKIRGTKHDLTAVEMMFDRKGIVIKDKK